MAKTNVGRAQNVEGASPMTFPAKPTRRGAPRNAQTVAASPTTTSPTVKLTKRDQLAGLLMRDQGATLDQMTAAMGWLPHTTRAALTGLRKAGYAIESDKIEGVRTYRVVAPK